MLMNKLSRRGFDGNGGSIRFAELGGGFHQGSCQMGRSR